MTSSHVPNSSIEQGGNRDLAAAITKAGSSQTYYTFRLLADRNRVDEGFMAYAYFRWLDDQLDCDTGTKQEKNALLERQQALIADSQRGVTHNDASLEEQMLVDLVRNDHEEQSGLKIYLHNMMQVMAFDVERCGRLVTHAELNEYTRLLSTAVTELMFYLFGHGATPPCGEGRYHAVYGAHVVHMLRDCLEDIPMGYINIPKGYIDTGQISIEQPLSLPFRKWVYERVKLGRESFLAGRKYIAQVKNLRCRMAGFAYIARFEWMLRVIEKENYCLRREYPERKSPKALVWMIWRVLASCFQLPGMMLEPAEQKSLTSQREEG